MDGFCLMSLSMFSTQSIYCFCAQNKKLRELITTDKQRAPSCCTNLERIGTNEIQPSAPFFQPQGPAGLPRARSPRSAAAPAPRARAREGLAPGLQGQPRAGSHGTPKLGPTHHLPAPGAGFPGNST